jgi:deazaflavin-dependent oxidoreductase (nitroreductase family)
LLLTTTGAKTGLSRTNPLMYFVDNDRYLVVASYAGAPRNPPWYYNLISNPTVGVEIGIEQFTARAEALPEPERSVQFAKIASAISTFAEYQRKTTRAIPMVALYRHR